MPTTKAKPKPARKMPKFLPAPQALKTRFAKLIANYPEAEPRQMFGYPCAFAQGQMFLGIFGDALMMRLSETDRAKYLQMPNAHLFEPMPGRPMKEYVMVTPALMKSDKELDRWIRKSIAYALSLPPKALKPKSNK